MSNIKSSEEEKEKGKQPKELGFRNVEEGANEII